MDTSWAGGEERLFKDWYDKLKMDFPGKVSRDKEVYSRICGVGAQYRPTISKEGSKYTGAKSIWLDGMKATLYYHMKEDER